MELAGEILGNSPDDTLFTWRTDAYTAARMGFGVSINKPDIPSNIVSKPGEEGKRSTRGFLSFTDTEEERPNGNFRRDYGDEEEQCASRVARYLEAMRGRLLFPTETAVLASVLAERQFPVETNLRYDYKRAPSGSWLLHRFVDDLDFACRILSGTKNKADRERANDRANYVTVIEKRDKNDGEKNRGKNDHHGDERITCSHARWTFGSLDERSEAGCRGVFGALLNAACAACDLRSYDALLRRMDEYGDGTTKDDAEAMFEFSLYRKASSTFLGYPSHMENALPQERIPRAKLVETANAFLAPRRGEWKTTMRTETNECAPRNARRKMLLDFFPENGGTKYSPFLPCNAAICSPPFAKTNAKRTASAIRESANLFNEAFLAFKGKTVRESYDILVSGDGGRVEKAPKTYAYLFLNALAENREIHSSDEFLDVEFSYRETMFLSDRTSRTILNFRTLMANFASDAGIEPRHATGSFLKSFPEGARRSLLTFSETDEWSFSPAPSILGLSIQYNRDSYAARSGVYSTNSEEAKRYVSERDFRVGLWKWDSRRLIRKDDGEYTSIWHIEEETARDADANLPEAAAILAEGKPDRRSASLDAFPLDRFINAFARISMPLSPEQSGFRVSRGSFPTELVRFIGGGFVEAFPPVILYAVPSLCLFAKGLIQYPYKKNRAARLLDGIFGNMEKMDAEERERNIAWFAELCAKGFFVKACARLPQCGALPDKTGSDYATVCVDYEGGVLPCAAKPVSDTECENDSSYPYGMPALRILEVAMEAAERRGATGAVSSLLAFVEEFLDERHVHARNESQAMKKEWAVVDERDKEELKALKMKLSRIS